MKNLTKVFAIGFTISVLMTGLFEATKNVHAAENKVFGKTILRMAKR